MSVAAPALVSVLALVYERLSDLGYQWSSDPSVRSVSVAVTPRRFQIGGDQVGCYADAELASGNAVAAWLEFKHENGSWVIESSILHNTAAGQDELVDLATRYAVEDDELIAELDGASRALVEAASSLVPADL